MDAGLAQKSTKLMAPRLSSDSNNPCALNRIPDFTHFNRPYYYSVI